MEDGAEREWARDLAIFHLPFSILFLASWRLGGAFLIDGIKWFSAHYPRIYTTRCALHVEKEMRDIAIPHHIRFALGSHLPRRFDGNFGLVLLQIIQRINLGTDET